MEVAVHEKNAVLKLGDPFCSFVFGISVRFFRKCKFRNVV